MNSPAHRKNLMKHIICAFIISILKCVAQKQVEFMFPTYTRRFVTMNLLNQVRLLVI